MIFLVQESRGGLIWRQIFKFVGEKIWWAGGRCLQDERCSNVKWRYVGRHTLYYFVTVLLY